ncbi:MAG: sulfotransferase [Candidatus Competibacteraceae bacterium]
MQAIKRIAMWAVPRSLATVLFRAWENRPDTAVWDEPLLVPYIFLKGEDFGFTREQAIAGGRETDWVKVISELTGPLPEGKSIGYQKHQPHNLLEETMGIAWIEQLTNCFLIRDPKDMLLSLHKLVPKFTFEQTGWAALKKLFDYIHKTRGAIPPVIDARDLQDNPRRTLSLLCDAVGVEFTEAMLSWPAKDDSKLPDAEKPWYDAAWKSTCFRPYKASTEALPEQLVDTFEKCNEIYQFLRQYRCSTRH